MYAFNVQDMTCGGCAASIRNAISRLPGVTAVNTDPATRDVFVEAGPEVSREAVIAAITAAGYCEITVVETTPNSGPSA